MPCGNVEVPSNWKSEAYASTARDTETFQTMQNALKLFKLIAQSEAEIAKGKVIRQKDLFDALERELDAL